MGLTFGAIGTSAPDAYMSFLLAKEYPAMSIANAFASNVFDIMLTGKIFFLSGKSNFKIEEYPIEHREILLKLERTKRLTLKQIILEVKERRLDGGH